MRNSSNTYLLFLACSDFFVVLTGLFIFWIDSARSYIPQLVQAPYTTVGFSMLLLHWLHLQLAGRICCIENMTLYAQKQMPSGVHTALRLHGPVLFHLLHGGRRIRLLCLREFYRLEIHIIPPFCLQVCWRRMSKQHCTVRRARRIVGAIVLCSVLYNSLRFPQFNLRKCIHDGSGEMVVEICPTSLFFRINTVYNGRSIDNRQYQLSSI
jgi:hypothetical protein